MVASNVERNVAGTPVFATVDLEHLAPVAVLELLKTFVASLWCEWRFLENLP